MINFTLSGRLRLLLAVLGTAAPLLSAQNWPAFRGANGAGVGNGDPPVVWDAETSQGVLWKTAIPGLGHSSPAVWQGRIYLTTAVAEGGSSQIDLTVSSGRRVFEEEGVHRWLLICVRAETGEILWSRQVKRGRPSIKRHVRGSHANASPATDGQHVVAFFGSEGLYCYDRDGRLLWHKDIGLLDAGYVGKPEYQWGTASSPIIYDGKVFVQCDSRGTSFVAAYDLSSGERVWRTERDEPPSWSTPVIYAGEGRAELITSSPNYFRGYDPESGRELWRFFDGAEVKVPTPVAGSQAVYFSGGAPRGRRYIAVRPGGVGDISPKGPTQGARHLVWQVGRGGPYTPTPLLYQGLLYVLADNGVLNCHDAKSGDMVYRKRVPERGASYSASPVAAAGRLYLASQEGDVHVVAAGPRFEVLASNSVGEPLMATPALAADVLLARGRHHLFAFRRQP